MQTTRVKQSRQLVVPANTATLEKLAEGYQHYGSVHCPFCEKLSIVAGPARETKGFCYLFQTCDCSAGIAAGHGADITIHFKGVPR